MLRLQSGKQIFNYLAAIVENTISAVASWIAQGAIKESNYIAPCNYESSTVQAMIIIVVCAMVRTPYVHIPYCSI